MRHLPQRLRRLPRMRGPMQERPLHCREDEARPDRVRMKRFFSILCVTALLFVAAPLGAAESTVETILPQACADGWVKEGPVSTYTRENLYKYIDGEAELYMPYGFRKAATVMYVKPGSKGGLVVNVFEMGSSLDAFGIYGNYRSPSLERVAVGTEGFADESELMFFKDRYFAQVSASGALTQERPLFLACAGSVAAAMPGKAAMPPEIEPLKVVGLVPASEKYFPEGLLGYGFLGKGLTADVMLSSGQVKAFVVLRDSPDGMERTIDAYTKYLRDSKAALEVSRNGRGTIIRATDPLFKGVVLQQSGRYGVGVAGLKNPHEADELVDRLISRLPKGG